MTKDLIEPEDYRRFCENTISIITFNYDRSFEHFFYESLINSFSDIPFHSTSTMKLMPFQPRHVYGVIAELPWQSDDGIEYGSELDLDTLEQLKENIKVIYDKTEDRLEEIRKRVANASRIFFLGFGYAKENLDILGIPGGLGITQKIYGTARGLTEREIKKIELIFSEPYNRGTDFLGTVPKNVKILSVDCCTLLREWL